MEANEIEWVSPTIPSDVFFTLAEFEKYSCQNRLIECLLQKEEELGPKSRLLNPDTDKPEAENPVGDTSIGEQSNSQQQVSHQAKSATQSVQECEQPLPTAQQKQLKKPQLKKKVCTQVKKEDGTLDSSQQNLQKAPAKTASTKSEPKTPKGPKSNLWAEVLASQDEPTSSAKAKGKKPAVCKWYPRLPYPRPSWLTMQEQADYLDLLSKQAPTRGQHQLQSKEILYFKELHQKVVAEQEEFMRYLESYAGHFPEHYQSLNQDAAGFINEYIGHLCERVVNYPQFYVQLDSVTLLPQRTLTSPIMLTHLRTLLEMGQVPRVLEPQLNATSKVTLNHNKVKQRFSPPQDEGKKPTCSFDSNAESLAIKYDADIVISSAGLKCLIDNHAPHFDRQWELPVVIKEYKMEGESGRQMRKVIYIDKPFPPKHPTTREKNAWYHKFAVKTFLQHPSHPKRHEFDKTKQKDEPVDTEQADAEEASLTELETFGNAPSMERPSAFKRYIRPEGKKSDTEDHKSQPGGAVGKTGAEENQDAPESKDCESVDKSLVRSTSEGFVVSAGDPFNVDQPSKSLQPGFTSCGQDKARIQEDKECVGQDKAPHTVEQDKPLHTVEQDKLINTVEQDKPLHTVGQDKALHTVEQDKPLHTVEQDKALHTVEPDKALNTVEQDKALETVETGKEAAVKNHDSSESGDSDDQLMIDVQPEAEDNETKDEKCSGDERLGSKSGGMPDDVEGDKAGMVETKSREDADITNVDKSKGHSGEHIKEEDIVTRTGVSGSLLTAEDGGMDEDRSEPSLFDFPKGKVINLAESGLSDDSEDEAGLVIDLPSDPSPGPEMRVTRRSLRSAAKGKTAPTTVQSKGASVEADKPSSGPVGGDVPADSASGAESRMMRSKGQKCTGQTTTVENVCTSKTEEVPAGRALRSRARLMDANPALQQSPPMRRGRPPKKKLQDVTAMVEESGSPVRRLTRSQGISGGSPQKHSSPNIGADVSDDKDRALSPKADEMLSPPKRQRRGAAPETASSGTPASPDNSHTLVRQSQKGGFTGAQAESPPHTPSLVSPATDSVKIIPLEPIQKSPPSEPKSEDEKCCQENVTEAGEIGTALTCEKPKDTQPSTKKRGTKKCQGGPSLQKSRKADCQSPPLSTLDSIMKAQEKFLETNKKPQVEAPTQQATVEQGAAAEAISQPMASDEWKPAEDPSYYKSFDQPNLTYNLWALGNLRILVRCGYHGNMKLKSPKKAISFVHLHSKLEYQPFFGAEQVTPSEAGRNWMDSYIRNAAKVIRARINSFTSEVMLLDHLQLADTLPKSGCFNPCAATTVLHGVLEKLSRLPASHYLLGHVPGNTQAHIKKNVETTSGVYDLHFAYLRGLPAQDRTQRLPWIPIDPNIQLFFHKKFKRVPATFEPKDSPNVQSTRQVRARKKRKH